MEVKGKKLQNCQFWQKNGQILATNGQVLVILEFSRHIHYDFLKEEHKGSFHTTNYENLFRRLKYRPKTLKNCYFGQKWPNFDHFLAIIGVKYFFKIFFGGHLHHMETQLQAKIQKKISNGQGRRTATNERTYGRMKANL